MKNTLSTLLFIPLACFLFGACQGDVNDTTNQVEDVQPTKEYKLISLNGSLTEILYSIGMEKHIIGVDVTSTFPKEVESLPKVGHISSLQAEGLIALGATHIVCEAGALKKELHQQLTSTGIEIVEFERDISVDGTKQLIRDVADFFNKEVPQAMFNYIDESLRQISPISPPPTVLFIYGRSAGNLMVAGENTPLEKIIELSGAVNAVTGFEDFKPLSNEVLISANPDYILMFDSAPSSLNGLEGILEIPGIKETTAGKNKNFIFLDGQLLSGFGPRVGEAARTLNGKYSNSNE